MTISLEDMKKSLSAERRMKIRSRAFELEAERFAFLRTCHAWELTRKQLADTLDLDDSTIDQERDWADVILSTLKNFIEAAGGKLTLSVQYPTHPPIDIEVLSWLDHEEIE